MERTVRTRWSREVIVAVGEEVDAIREKLYILDFGILGIAMTGGFRRANMVKEVDIFRGNSGVGEMRRGQ